MADPFKILSIFVLSVILLVGGGATYTYYFSDPRHDIGIVKSKYQDVDSGSYFIHVNSFQYKVDEADYKKVTEGDKVDVSFTGGDLFKKQIKSVEKAR